MQECEKIQDLMLAYFDGKLDAGQTRILNRHLETCAQCRDLFEGMEVLRKAEKTLSKDTPADLHEQIMGAVRWDARLSRLRARARRRAWVAAACACLVLFAAGTLSLLRMGGMKSADSSASDMTSSNMAPPQSGESSTQDSDYDENGADGSAPEENGDADSDAGNIKDDMKGEQDSLSQQGLQKILDALGLNAADVDVALCNTPDLEALEAASGVRAVEAGGYWTLLVDADAFDALLGQGMLAAADGAGQDTNGGVQNARVLVILFF